jgi:hypothetical protein
MRDLLQHGGLPEQDLRLAWPDRAEELTTTETGGAPEVNDLIDFLTKPRYFKHLIPLLKKNDPLRDRLIHEAADRPYSATLVPELWGQSALNLLGVAKEKYGRQTTYEEQQSAPDATPTISI